jgi:hypothetical protein
MKESFLTEQSPVWKRELLATWAQIGAEAVFERAGLNFQEAFLGALDAYKGELNPYADHEWSVFQFPRLTSGVVHAAPKSIKPGEHVLWEEWYFEDGSSHHNVMRNHPHELEEKVVTLNDDEHPAIIMNMDWHYYDDSDRRPFLLR